ncbi:rhodanese-like domain-containing protein [Pseudidiomarina sp. E22-M8]|uniref:rhodanese-like domain-containing protein n=1 Tax=Pseudidiomarina sp. E22-M8 TaxID=3424768 RepID=UPI00403D414B
MTRIDTETLQGFQTQGHDFVLVDTLPADAFAKEHLPDAINIVSDDIVDEAPQRLPDKQATIVVYCASES